MKLYPENDLRFKFIQSKEERHSYHSPLSDDIIEIVFVVENQNKYVHFLNSSCIVFRYIHSVETV